MAEWTIGLNPVVAGTYTRALPALAATPYAFKHGAFDVTVVSDGHLVLPTGSSRHRRAAA